MTNSYMGGVVDWGQFWHLIGGFAAVAVILALVFLIGRLVGEIDGIERASKEYEAVIKNINQEWRETCDFIGNTWQQAYKRLANRKWN